MDPLPTGLARSILILHLAGLNDAHKFADAIKLATEQTSERLLIILFCDVINEDRHLNHSASWDEVQGLLTFVYVEATRVAQDADRILMDVSVLLRGLEKEVNIREEDGWQHVFALKEGVLFLSCASYRISSQVWIDLSEYPLPSWVTSIPATTLPVTTHALIEAGTSENPTREEATPSKPSTYPVVALGGTFDHLHSGHKILLSMSAWIAHEKVIIGVTGKPQKPLRSASQEEDVLTMDTDDKLLQKKANRHVLEPLDVRIEHVRRFLDFFKPGLVYDAVPIDDVYGPTAVDPNIQALVVSKETLGGASASKSTSFILGQNMY